MQQVTNLHYLYIVQLQVDTEKRKNFIKILQLKVLQIFTQAKKLGRFLYSEHFAGNEIAYPQHPDDFGAPLPAPLPSEKKF